MQRRNEGSAPPGLPTTFIPMMLHTFLPGDGKNPCQLVGVKGAAKNQNPIPSSFFRKRFYPPKNLILGPCKAHKSLLGNPSWKSSTPIFRFAQSPKPSNKTKNSTQLCCVVGLIILFSSHIKKTRCHAFTET